MELSFYNLVMGALTAASHTSLTKSRARPRPVASSHGSLSATGSVRGLHASFSLQRTYFRKCWQAPPVAFLQVLQPRSYRRVHHKYLFLPTAHEEPQITDDQASNQQHCSSGEALASKPRPMQEGIFPMLERVRLQFFQILRAHNRLYPLDHEKTTGSLLETECGQAAMTALPSRSI